MEDIAMQSLPKSIDVRYTSRKRRLLHSRTQRVPALSTPEAAALVMGVIEAQLEDGLNLDQIGWHRFCRDIAVVQVVTRQLEHCATIKEEG
jgi:hypothetical protein